MSGTSEPEVSRVLARTLAREEHRRSVRRTALALSAVAFLTGAAISAIGWSRPGPNAAAAAAPTSRAARANASTAATKAVVADVGAVAPEATVPRQAPQPAPQAAAPTPAPAPRTAVKPAATTASQTFSIAIGTAGYEPSQVVAAAGRPVTLKVGKGEGCAGGFLMPSLGVNKDNSGGPVTVKLGALAAGRYQWTCGMGMVTGTLVIR